MKMKDVDHMIGTEIPIKIKAFFGRAFFISVRDKEELIIKTVKIGDSGH